MKKFWALFFFLWPTVALIVCYIAPSRDWWFYTEAMSPLGVRIDNLFYMILWIVTAVFIGTQYALGYVMWKGATKSESQPAHFSHGSHSLELIWTIVPAFVLVFIALYQMDVWRDFRVKSSFPEETQQDGAQMEITARQFEWRIRYPGPGKQLELTPQSDDLYAVNEVHIPTGRPVKFNLRTDDVQHAFFAPELRIKQDAVPGKVIPVWVMVEKSGTYNLLCAELCGWGHYKMRANIYAEPEEQVQEYMEQLLQDQNDDGVSEDSDDADDE